MTIFLSIPSYGDPQLVPTVQDALAKAAHPEDLRFGIVRQRGDDEPSLPFANNRQFRILDVSWKDSQGVCWARSEAQKFYDGEPWYLQIDAHTRLVEGWDRKLIDLAARTTSDRPILTAYPPAFVPDDSRSFEMMPKLITFNDFGLYGVPGPFGNWAMSEVHPDWSTRREPIRGRFCAGGFLFAPGRFVEDVPYDPDLVDIGEEVTLSIRAFTHGYDLFQPTEVLGWHWYRQPTRPDGRPRPHEDHAQVNGAEWSARAWRGITRARRFLQTPWVGPFGCGSARTFADYEAYAGIDFARQVATDYAREFLEPPNPQRPANWVDRLAWYDCVVRVRRAAVPPDATEFVLGFWTTDRHLVFKRRYLRSEAHVGDANGAATLTWHLQFASEGEPVLWRVSIHSPTAGWLQFEQASPEAWVWIRRTAPWEPMDWRYTVRHRERLVAERYADQFIEKALTRPRDAEDASGPNAPPDTHDQW